MISHSWQSWQCSNLWSVQCVIVNLLKFCSATDITSMLAQCGTA